MSKKNLNCNYALLAEYATAIKGKRSIGDLVLESGLSRSFVSKIINQNLLSVPSKRSLKMLSDVPGHNISYTALLEAADYDFVESDTDIEVETVSFEKAASDYYSEKPASFALGLLLDLLVKKGFTESFDVKFTTDNFYIKPSDKTFEVVGIPVFFSNNADVEGACLIAIRKFIDAIYKIGELASYIYLITDNSAAYQYMIKVLPPSPKGFVYVSYTNDYKHFMKQYDVNDQLELVHKKSSKQKETDLFSGVLI